VDNKEQIVLGGGCFWCMDATFKLVKGIIEVEEGYSGGTVANPTDEQIYYEDTGHAEVVRLTFDPKVISLKKILEIFFIVHDPTTLNRQGPDSGTIYRSIIFFKDDKQKAVVEQALEDARELWDDKIVTYVEQFKVFYPADEHHKYYETNRPDYCQLVINPKLAKLRSKFSELLK
jgi:peptide-methionine (S)-S-oxide reductase